MGSEEDALHLLWAASVLNVVEAASDVAHDRLVREMAGEEDVEGGIEASQVLGWLPQVAAIYCAVCCACFS